jgi:hypothetical protein
MLLRIRQSSPLFRLQTAEEINNRLQFHNTGPDQIPGLIVMSISDTGQTANLDPNADMALVLFNATPENVTYTLPEALAGATFSLHPEQAVLADSTLRGEGWEGEALLPPRSTTILVGAEGGFPAEAEDGGLPTGTVAALGMAGLVGAAAAGYWVYRSRQS